MEEFFAMLGNRDHFVRLSVIYKTRVSQRIESEQHSRAIAQERERLIRKRNSATKGEPSNVI